MTRIVVATMLVAVSGSYSLAQNSIHWKASQKASRDAAPDPPGESEAKSRDPMRIHRVVRYPAPPGDAERARLELSGARILQYVPDNGLLVSTPKDWTPPEGTLQAAGLVASSAKWSRALDDPTQAATLLAEAGSLRLPHFVVEFFPDVSPGDARAIAGQEQLHIVSHPDLLAHHLLVEATPEQARKLTAWDEVAYVFPASDALVAGAALQACPGALTIHGPVGQYIERVGEGWDGPGRNSAELTYAFEKLTAKLPAGAAQAEIEKAMAEWSRHVRVRFTPGTGPQRHVGIRFETGSHGDPFPFDGPGRTLAHTFYPAPPNPEPIAGDLHFDDAEPWRVGTDIDVFSVALHELGHALGLAHADKPGAVMYAYYSKVSALTQDDIDAIRELYAANTGTDPAPQPPPSPAPSPNPPPQNPQPAPVPNPPPPSNPEPTPPGTDKVAPSLRITYPGTATFATTAASITIRGTASDNVAVSRVTFAASTGGSGTASGTKEWSAEVPLVTGVNTITVRAYDAAGNSSWRSSVVTRR